MAKRTRKNYTIRNPHKWIGRTVNSFFIQQQLMWDFCWDDNEGVTVCAWTHKVITMQEANECAVYFTPDQWQAIESHPHFDPCYYYSMDALGEFCDEIITGIV